jgi:ribosomal protein L21
MAVVKIGGKQFVVNEGKNIIVPFCDLEIGKTLEAKDLLTGEMLEFVVIDQKRSSKVIVLKFRNKTRYQRLIGQRTKQTVLKNVEKKVKTEPTKATEKAVSKKSPAKKG